ncbi:MAG: MbcA/ParS/Xre antitoxin family protein [Nitrococcus sp.]|nr:MbcA/ParS/Xre antitoxin family protein [Nitrococcus sp.]
MNPTSPLTKEAPEALGAGVHGQVPPTPLGLRQQALETALTKWKDDRRRRVAAKAVVMVLGDWKLSAANKLRLLGLSRSSRGQLSGYASGETPLRPTEDAWRRASGLIAIDRNLRVFAPRNPEWRNAWVHSSVRGLDGERPIEIMLIDGIGGIDRIRRYTASMIHR